MGLNVNFWGIIFIKKMFILCYKETTMKKDVFVSDL